MRGRITKQIRKTARRKARQERAFQFFIQARQMQPGQVVGMQRIGFHMLHQATKQKIVERFG